MAMHLPVGPSIPVTVLVFESHIIIAKKVDAGYVAVAKPVISEQIVIYSRSVMIWVGVT